MLRRETEDPRKSDKKGLWGFLPPLRGKGGWGVASVSVGNVPPTPALPLEGGGRPSLSFFTNSVKSLRRKIVLIGGFGEDVDQVKVIFYSGRHVQTTPSRAIA